MEEKDDLMIMGDITGVAQRPQSIDPKDRRGTENIRVDEIRMPRLCHAQGLSKQMTPGNALYIDTLKMFDMFNDVTREVYGKGPLAFVPLRRDVRHIEWRPMKEGGGIIDANVPEGDPRLEWRLGAGGPDGKDLPPIATTYTEFVAVLLQKNRPPEPIVISIKHTNKESSRAADTLTTLVKLRPGPIFAGIYLIEGAMATNDNGTYGVPIIKDGGWIPKDSPAGAKLYTYAEETAEALAGKEIIVNREPGEDDGPVSFDPPVDDKM